MQGIIIWSINDYPDNGGGTAWKIMPMDEIQNFINTLINKHLDFEPVNSDEYITIDFCAQFYTEFEIKVIEKVIKYKLVPKSL